MNKDNLTMFISYGSIDGGTNNIQIVHVVKPSEFKGLADIIKTFTSKNMQALPRAKSYIKNYK